MVSLEQVKLLESKVTKTIEYVKKVTEENTLLKGKLNSHQQRIDELEVLIKQFKEEQSRIEDGILSALDRLNQFEDALESKLTQPDPDFSVNKAIGKEKSDVGKPAAPPAADELVDELDDSKLQDPYPLDLDPELPEPAPSQGQDNELDIF